MRADTCPPNPPAKPSPLLLDAKALAHLLSASPATVWRWDASGKLAVKPLRLTHGTTRWYRPAIEKWLAECQRAGRLIDRKEWESLQVDK